MHRDGSSATTELAAALRLEVGRFRRQQSRRVFDTVVSVGVPAGDRAAAELPRTRLGSFDIGLRTDVVQRLLQSDGAPEGAAYAWLSRPGSPCVHDLDLQWLAAATMAAAELGRRLEGFFAVTREGWLDVVTGDQRVWRRLRV